MHRFFLPLTLALTTTLAYGQQNTKLDSLNSKGQEQYRAQQYEASAHTYELALRTPGLTPRKKASIYYNLACDYGLLNNAPLALKYTQKAVAAGYSDAANLANDPDLKVLHTDKRWPKLVAAVHKAEEQKYVRRVQDIKLVTTDIDRFWQAYAQARLDTTNAAAIFQREYFDKASIGLQDYYSYKIRNAQTFARRIIARPQYYASIQSTMRSITDQKPQMLAAFQKFQALYPPARFQHIYFVVGGFSSGGTVSDAGLLIGADQTANGPGVNTSELNLLQRNRCGMITEMPSLLVHELVHSNQGPQDGTLLSYTINEGMADFVTELVTGTLGNNARLHVYGNAHEKELWAAFKQEMGGRDASNWIANGRQETAEKPCDLGYYVGYKICQAYYSKATDKQKALADILNITDAKAFLAASGYEDDLARR
ncbi:TPR end-of-group domain-containing protein [Hymenobacter sp. CRA2]|uniref:gliding motility protein GldB-related protein n=1 Tax=Hymenobacter sp. CRA2 TaxID=1955620 RepID=UPI00098FC5C5|nr:DUF2268 domain-containing putative Zn-dependent protease [Hymenobacter sp. CRA2]OON70297.1 hypothetical protein B0919_06080 [Hymenobacter sp. CRA2]